MKKEILISIEKETVVMNGQSCNFIESGLMPNGEKVTDRDEIIEYFTDKYEGEEIEVIFDDYEKRYIINDLSFLAIMGFSSDEIRDFVGLGELMLFVHRGETTTISVTPSDVDYYSYVLNKEKDIDIIVEVLNDISESEKAGLIVCID